MTEDEANPSVGWRDISTAPRDGTRVLVGRFTGKPKADHEGRQAVDFWHSHKKNGCDGWGQFNTYYWPATHWMPLPSPPAEAASPESLGVSQDEPLLFQPLEVGRKDLEIIPGTSSPTPVDGAP